jgi:hypothetical protein
MLKTAGNKTKPKTIINVGRMSIQASRASRASKDLHRPTPLLFMVLGVAIISPSQAFNIQMSD